MRPHLGQIERIIGCLFRIFLRHHLDTEVPLRKISPLDSFKQIPLVAFPVLSDDFGGFGIGHILDTLHSLEMELDPEPLVFGINETVGVRAKAVHVAIALRDVAVGKENRHLM